MGALLGVVLISIALLPQLYWLYEGYASVSAWEEGLWSIYIGCLFLGSYFAEHLSFLFRGMARLAEIFHAPGGKRFALVYAAMFVGMGCWILISELLFGP